MLEIRLVRAYEPEMMKRQPCGMCGVEFQPEAVLAEANIPNEGTDMTPVCVPCLYHLGFRARDIGGDGPPSWDWDYPNYLMATARYKDPLFPSADAVIEAERRDPNGTDAIFKGAIL